MEEEDNVVLQHLRAIRADLGEVKDTLAQHGRRLTNIEQGQADIRREISHDAAISAE